MKKSVMVSDVRKSRVLGLALGVVLLGALLSGCGSVSNTASGTTEMANEAMSIGMPQLQVAFSPGASPYFITWVNPGTYINVRETHGVANLILYTTDGSTPGSSPTTQSGPSGIPSIWIPVNGYLVLKAKAIASGWNDSPIVTGVYSLAVFQR